VGDHHEGDSLVVGVDAWTVLTGWYVRGSFLPGNQASEAVVGDSLARKMFTDPVSQSIHALNRTFDITGICFDPVNNGYVTYVPLRALQNVTNLQPNILMVRVSSSINSTDKLNEVRNMVNSANADFEVVELNSILDRNLGFLSNIWSVIMFLPLLSLVAVSLCLMGYVTLSLNEQRQEFGVLRALGAKPRTVLKIVSWQSLVVLLSSYVVGVAFGIIVTMLILVPDPLVTNFTVLEIAGWLMASLAATFLLSLSPTFRFGEKPIREIMS
jgi:ABC-type antimicrobial peptide transport system permease subunit